MTNIIAEINKYHDAVNGDRVFHIVARVVVDELCGRYDRYTIGVSDDFDKALRYAWQKVRERTQEYRECRYDDEHGCLSIPVQHYRDRIIVYPKAGIE